MVSKSPKTIKTQSQGANQELSAKKLAFDVCMAEYNRMIEEIMTGLEWHKSLIQYSLAIIAGAATAIGLFPDFTGLYLIAATLLTAIGWAFAEQSLKMLTFGRYIAIVLAPKINQLISEVAPEDEKLSPNLQGLMGFDDFFRSGDFRAFVAGFLALGKFATAVLPGLGFLIAYLFAISEPFAVWPIMQKILFSTIVVASIIPILFGLFGSPFYFRHIRPKV